MNQFLLHVSGSAYKIAKDRAYHHGTMLISSQLSTLGDVLYVSKVWFSYYHYTLAYISDWCVGIYDNPRRRVDPLASKEFARIQSYCNSRQICASYGPSLPRGVSRRRARTPVPQGHFIIFQLITAPSLWPRCNTCKRRMRQTYHTSMIPWPISL
jgi:hypothetical protein